jgi:hypothetical protein
MHLQPETFKFPLAIGALNPFQLESDLANLLYHGGAYCRNMSQQPRLAKNLAADFCDALFGDRFGEVDIFRCNFPWNDWFYDVAWDYTYFGIDRRLMRVWLLCTTDTD